MNRVVLAILALLALALPAAAQETSPYLTTRTLVLNQSLTSSVGSATCSIYNPSYGGVNLLYRVLWTSDSSGDARFVLPPMNGLLIKVRTMPSTGATSPTAAYDVRLLDPGSINVLDPDAGITTATTTLSALGDDRSSTATEVFEPYRVNPDGDLVGLVTISETLTGSVSGAGAANTGTIDLVIRQ